MTETKENLKGLHWYHWVIVFSSLVLTFIAWYISHSQVQEKVKLQFEFQSEQLLALISERMSRYEDALRAGAAAYHSQSQGIDVIEWRRFANILQLETTYPGINGIGIIYYVPPNKLDAFLKNERRLRPDFKIKPNHENNEFWPITYVEPVEINKQAVGLDMAFETNRWTAAKLARDTGETQITAPIILVQDSQKTPGFLQYVPIYRGDPASSLEERRSNFVGHVYAPFIMYKLIAGTLEQKNRRLLFSVFDENVELYNELKANVNGFEEKPQFSKVVSLSMYGRPWTFTIQTAASFRKETSTNQPVVILIAGLSIDSMLLAFFIMLSKSHKRALNLANLMTEKHAISEEFYKNVIDSAPCGIAIVDQFGQLTEVNQQMSELFGYSEEELTEMNVDMLVPQEFRNSHGKYRTEFMKKPKDKQMGHGKEIFCLKKDGSTFPAEIGLANFKIQDRTKIIATITNISAYIVITNELRRSNKDLDDFAYVASHDLKAPLRGIIQLSSWIEEDIQESASEDTKENLSLLKSRTKRLEKLLDDLLIYSRIGRKQGEICSVDLNLLLDQIFELMNPEGEIKLAINSTLPTLTTLVTPLETIFRNLIGNAIKHNDKEDSVITVDYKELPDKYAFEVSDNGPGISPKHHAQIFELFKTLKPRDEVEGSGMGLSIVKKTLESLNQMIELKSDIGKGTTFIFTWPKDIKPKDDL
ncbi:CHASE domain-containing protein [Aliikangiella maris]|uniref:histidine kinase n=2 Tax=Aliikangiella maris TaxID=3162458 RepID=A0ABV3MJN9_9GAMM